MNMNPAEPTLALWLDDELTGDELAAVETWASGQPEQLAAREEVRHWRATIAAAVPSSEEPPYPDFFNSRVLQAIRESTPRPAPVRMKRSLWKGMLMPLAACAGMMLAFWFGAKSADSQESEVTSAPHAIPVEPAVYTPEKGVDAKWFASSPASATVIVLSGVAAIPDTTDFSETAYLPSSNPEESTASANPEQ